MLDVSIDTTPGATIIRPKGDVDLSTSKELQHALKEAIGAKPAKLAVDLGDVPYMDSSGVATLVEAMQLSRKQDAPLVLFAMQDKVRSIFEIARLDRVFTIVASEDDALGG